MPIAHFHLVDGTGTADQRARLLTEACRSYARVLDAPVDRVRAFVVRYPAEEAATAGTLLADGGAPAPYFTAIVLAGRPIEQRRRLAAEFTRLIVEILGVPPEVVRGQVVEVSPQNWFIAGHPADQVRATEIAARAESGTAP